MSPRSKASPTTVERKLLVTLKVMSTRCGLAPLGDEVAVAEDDPGRRAARLERPDGVVEGLAGLAQGVVQGQVARGLRFAGDREIDGLLEPARIEAHRFRRPPLPVIVGAGIVEGCGSWRFRPTVLGLGQHGSQGQAEDEQGDRGARHGSPPGGGPDVIAWNDRAGGDQGWDWKRTRANGPTETDSAVFLGAWPDQLEPGSVERSAGSVRTRRKLLGLDRSFRLETVPAVP